MYFACCNECSMLYAWDALIFLICIKCAVSTAKIEIIWQLDCLLCAILLMPFLNEKEKNRVIYV